MPAPQRNHTLFHATRIHPNQIVQWKQQLLSHSKEYFPRGGKMLAESGPTVQEFHAKIGKLTIENDLLEAALSCLHDASAPRCSI